MSWYMVIGEGDAFRCPEAGYLDILRYDAHDYAICGSGASDIDRCCGIQSGTGGNVGRSRSGIGFRVSTRGLRQVIHVLNHQPDVSSFVLIQRCFVKSGGLDSSLIPGFGIKVFLNAFGHESAVMSCIDLVDRHLNFIGIHALKVIWRQVSVRAVFQNIPAVRRIGRCGFLVSGGTLIRERKILRIYNSFTWVGNCNRSTNLFQILWRIFTIFTTQTMYQPVIQMHH